MATTGSSRRRWKVGSQPTAGDDPAAELSPTAARILEASKRILDAKGYDGLTFEAIASESGENRASIRYHFGNKAGLIAALADSVVHDDNVVLLERLRATADGDRVGTMLEMHRRSTSRREYHRFWDLLPHLVRDDDLRPLMAELYAWYRDLDEWALAPDASAELKRQLDPLCALTVAVCDGLATQTAADPDFDIEAAFDYWEGIVREACLRAYRAVGLTPRGEPEG